MSVPVQAEQLFNLAGLPITNSMINAWIAILVFVVLALALRKPASGAPRGIRNAAEAVLEFMLGFMDQVTQDRRKSRKFFPIVGTLFLFILISNWMGLLPGVGTIGLWATSTHGEAHLIPLFRPATSDLNMTLAMGIAAVVMSHIFGIRTIGFFRHVNKFIQLGSFWQALVSFRRKKLGDYAIGLFVAFVELGVGIIELISEVAKIVSLSLRLFGNIFAGEVLIHVMMSLIAFIIPLPFMAMEIIVGVVQALVFAMLTLVYLTISTSEPHGEAEHEEHSEPEQATESHQVAGVA
ncbi:F0F1 ATP synthase subunit A [Patescibacteria group bacterium]|nr:F0F1 ATP synthase subunit A [Patescibacteria group bacterium]